MATITSTFQPENPAPKGVKPRTRTRHFSLVEPNQRHNSKSSVSEEVKAKPRCFSVVADGKPKVKPRVPVRKSSLVNILADSDSKVVKVENKENEKPKRAARRSKVPVPVHKAVCKVNYCDVLAKRLADLAVALPEEVINIDIEDGLYDYAADVIVYLRERELNYQLPANFLRGGSTTPEMRSMLVDWLIQVQHFMKMSQETLYLTIIMIDTVLSKRDIQSDKLQLVGISCLFMASKLEEYYPADIEKLISLTSDSYTKKQVLRMELVIFELLEHQLYFPEIMPFLKRYARAAHRGQDRKFVETCQYLIDTSIIDPTFSTTPPSQRAAASVLASSLLFSVQVNEEGPSEDEVWSLTLRHYSKYHVIDLVEIARTMFKSFTLTKYEGALKKYESNSMHQRLAHSEHVLMPNIKLALAWLDNRISKL